VTPANETSLDNLRSHCVTRWRYSVLHRKYSAGSTGLPVVW